MNPNEDDDDFSHGDPSDADPSQPVASFTQSASVLEHSLATLTANQSQASQPFTAGLFPFPSHSLQSPQVVPLAWSREQCPTGLAADTIRTGWLEAAR
jgi:hypothetical protein